MFVVLGIKHAMRQYCHLWPVRLYSIFRYYLINGTIFGENFTERKMCVLSLHILSEIFLIPRINRKDTVINVQTYHCKVPVILVKL